MAIAQSQEAVAQSTQMMGAPTRGLAAAWSGDAAVQMFMEIAVIAAVPAVAAVGASRASFPLLPAAVPGLAGLPKNSIITATPFTVRGLPFGNRPLTDYISLWGATVSPASNDEKVYIIDFHGLRNVRNVSVTGGGALKIRPWEGLRFAEKQIELKTGQTLNLLTQKIEVTLSNALSQADFEAKTQIDCQSYPSNVRFVIAQSVPEKDQDGNFIVPQIREDGNLLLLSPIPFAQATGKEPILWTYNGDLAGEVTLPDFSRELNEFLESSPAQDGLCFPHLVAYSDTPGFLQIQETDGSPFVSLNYLTTVEFAGEDPLSTTATFQRHADNQTIDLVLFREQDGQFITPAGVDASAPKVRVQQLRFELSGTMDDDRLDRDASWTTQTVPAKAQVSGIFSLAQPITVQMEYPIAGIDLCLSAETNADLVLELQGDANGTPDGTALATAAIDIQSVTEAPGWVSARFSEEINVIKGQTVWAVLKARAGTGHWQADAGGPDRLGRLHFSRDGAFWTTHTPPLTGLYKLKVIPPPADRPAPLTAEVLTRKDIALQPTETPQSIVILFDASTEPHQGNVIPLELTPQGVGQVTLSSVVVEYIPVPAPPPETSS